MGINVNIINSIKTRIENAIQNGTLTDVKRFRIGGVEESRQEIDLPVINLVYIGGTENPDYPNKQRYDEVELKVSLICSKNADEACTLYDTATNSGGLYLFEKMRDVIDNDIYGNPDNTFDLSVAYDKMCDYSINESSGVVEFALTMRLRSKSYFSGNRGQ